MTPQRVNEIDLDSDFAWVDFHFARTENLARDQKVCLVVSAVAGTDAAAEIEFESSGDNMTDNTHGFISNDGKLTWSEPNDSLDMRFYIIGEHNAVMAPRRAFESVRIELQIGENSTTYTTCTSNFFNQPETDTATDSIEPADPVELGETTEALEENSEVDAAFK